jgi:5-methylcytosine-specific restriction endonuclease McrA
VGTRVNSDRADVIQRRHQFFVEKMRERLKLQLLDSQRAFGALERELIYYRDKKKCAVCEADVTWDEAEIHHVEPFRSGGRVALENGALVHTHCHPKGNAAEAAFATKWRVRKQSADTTPTNAEIDAAKDLDEDGVDLATL